jgi:hypothetical protein
MRIFASSQSISPFPFGGKGETGKDVLPCQLGEVGYDFIMRHACRKSAQHIVNRDAGVPYAGLPETLGRIDCDNVVKTFHVLFLL